MFGYSLSAAALALEGGGLVSLFGYGNGQTLLLGYLAAHAAASALAAAALVPLLARQQRSRPMAAYAFFFAIAFFVPVLGIAGLLGTVLVGRLVPEKARSETIEMHQAPVYDPRAGEVAGVRSKGGARVQLGDAGAPVETRLKALLAVQALPARVANPMVREMLSDPSDDLRLVAYGILDAREKSINARIHAASQRLQTMPPARERAQLERQLADLYWELVYQGLVQGDLRAHALTQSRVHLDQALSLDPEDAGLWSLCGRLASQEGDYGEAERAFGRARRFGLPEARVLPYLAEVAFRQRRYDEVREIAGRLAAGPHVERISQVIRYWGSRVVADTAAPSFPTATSADIGLLLEGTYPFIAGGVSSWVHQIIRAFPEHRFALCFLGSTPSDYGAMKYKLPDNVVHLETHYIHSGSEKPRVRAEPGDPKAFDMVRRLHKYFREPALHSGEVVGESLASIASTGNLSDASFLYSRASWDYVTEQYREFSRDPSFIDYFWTVRTMHQPLWMLARVAETFPAVRAYHTVSTGYAGFLAAMLRWKTGKPLILSEHGIYTKERKIDLFQSEWIKDNRDPFDRDPAEIGYLRQLWIRFFESLGRMCYDASDDIVALYEANRVRQVADGARAERTRNVPNGIDLPRLAALRSKRAADDPRPILCLLGRVVPIKDVKTFVRAIRVAANRMPDIEGWIAGPEDEDPGYAEECRALADSLGVADKVKFLGFQKIDELLPKVGLLVLSSISEALPLVILEGYAAGVPSVATDVGSCRQLIYGLPGEDAELGASGRVVGIADPTALAGAALELLGDAKAWRDAQKAGIRRVERYYTQERMVGSYRELYSKALSADAPVPKGAA